MDFERRCGEMKIIPNWQNKKLRCYLCGEKRSVKYEVEVFDTETSDKPTIVCVCNKCALRYTLSTSEKGGTEV